MKFRFLALAAALLTMGYGATWTFAQDSDKTAAQDSAQNSTQADKGSGPVIAQPAEPDKVKHDGGEDDVDAIGNRNVGCNRGMGNWYTVEGQIKRGKSYAMQIESQSKMV